MATENATTKTLADRSSEAAVRNGATIYTPTMISPPWITPTSEAILTRSELPSSSFTVAILSMGMSTSVALSPPGLDHWIAHQRSATRRVEPVRDGPDRGAAVQAGHVGDVLENYPLGGFCTWSKTKAAAAPTPPMNYSCRRRIASRNERHLAHH